MILNKLLKKGYPALDWIQVEISSMCNAECIYCPHSEYRKSWKNRLMPIELYRSLIPAFSKTGLVFLQGWGEPFMHPDFLDFLRQAKRAGCMVGTTTNGTLLDSEKIRELIDEGLDIIGFSLAGTDEKNDIIRKGTSIKKVLDCMEEIHRLRGKDPENRPKIHVAYMLLRSGLRDIHKIPAFLENAGAEHTVISSLSLAVNSEMEKERITASDETESRELVKTFNAIEKEGEKRGTEIYFNVVSPLMKESSCSENIRRALVTGSDGNVSPCVMGNIPAAGDNFYYFRGIKKELHNISFGSILNESLKSIWHRKEYKEFRIRHRKGKSVFFCGHCQKHYIMNIHQ